MKMDPFVERALDEYGYAQVIAVLEQPAPGAGLGTLGPDDTAAVMDLFLPAAPPAAAAPTVGTLAAAEKRPALAARQFPRLGVAVGFVDRERAEAMAAHSKVEDIQPAEQLSLIRPVKAGAGTYSGRVSWGIRRIGADRLWAEGLTGKGVRVGHLDTGVDGKHAALAERIRGFAEFDFEGERKPKAKPHDSDEHGTHTAGTICGGKIRGMAIGVAPKADLYSGLVIEGGNALLRVLSGLEWLLEEKAQVLSLSLGFRGFTPFFRAITVRLREQGMLPVFAIGNEGPGTSRSPGNYSEALSVGAVDTRRRMAWFSSSIIFNRPDEPRQPNVVAPGVGVVSARPGGGGQMMDGTSMATPHIAGLAALLIEAKPDATVAQVEEAIQKTSEALKREDPTRFGFGFVNGPLALKYLLEH
jgi:subtilisin family serine protease